MLELLADLAEPGWLDIVLGGFHNVLITICIKDKTTGIRLNYHRTLKSCGKLILPDFLMTLH